MQRRHFLLAGSGLLASALISACGGGDEEAPALLTRRNVTDWSAQERDDFIATLHAMKDTPSAYRPDTNAYDYFVAIHVEAFATHSVNAHMSAGFLPWHREMLKRFELELRRVSGNPQMTLGYWDWHQPGAHAQIFTPDFLGGNGDANDNFLVKDGAFKAGAWTLNSALFDDTPDEFTDTDGDGKIDPNNFAGPLTSAGLTRRFVYQGDVQSDLSCVDTLMASRPLAQLFERQVYDAAPYMEYAEALSPSEAFNLFDEWTDVSMRKFLEARWHNPIHAIIGGQMGASSSPNDPAFFLHHCNVDRIWALWQSRYANTGYPSATENLDTSAGTTLDILSQAGVVRFQDTFDLAQHSGVRYAD